MDKLTNKSYDTFEYLSRYAGAPYFYDTVTKKVVPGITQQMDRSTPYLSHKVTSSDTLDSLSLQYYNDPTFWWVIAQFNVILDPFINLYTKYPVIRIPNISGITFKE